MVFLITGDGGLEHEFGIFHHIWSVILPIDSYFSRWFLHHQPVITIISEKSTEDSEARIYAAAT